MGGGGRAPFVFSTLSLTPVATVATATKHAHPTGQGKAREEVDELERELEARVAEVDALQDQLSAEQEGRAADAAQAQASATEAAATAAAAIADWEVCGNCGAVGIVWFFLRVGGVFYEKTTIQANTMDDVCLSPVCPPRRVTRARLRRGKAPRRRQTA